MRGWVRTLGLRLALATAAALALSTASAGAYVSYDYQIVVDASATGNAITPQPPNQYFTGESGSGSLSSSWTSAWLVHVVADSQHKYIHVTDENPNPGLYQNVIPNDSLKGTHPFTGSDSWSVQLSSSGVGLSVSCAATGAPMSEGIAGVNLVESAPYSWDSNSYTSGKMTFQFSPNRIAAAPTRHVCSDSGNTGIYYMYVQGPNNPGMDLNWCSSAGGQSPAINIPVADLGKQHVVLDQTADPLPCQSEVDDSNSGGGWGFTYTGHVHYTVTLDQLGGDHIASLHAPLNVRLQTLRGILSARAEDLLRRRADLAPILQDDRQRFDAAVAQERKAQSDKREVEGALKAIKAAIAALTAADNALPPAGRASVTRRDRLAAEVERLKDLILSAQNSGDTGLAQGLVPQLESAERQLARADADVQRLVPPKLFTGPLAMLAAAHASLSQRLDQLEADIRHAANAQEVAAVPFLRSLQKNQDIDQQLIELGAQLAQTDLQLRGVSVYVGNTVVYHAVADGPFAKLQQINQELFKARSVLLAADQRRQAAKHRWLDLENHAGYLLTRVEQTIRDGSYKKAGVDMAFNLWDVGWAALEGGLVGAAKETLGKLADTVAKEYVFPEVGGGVQPGTIEAEVNRELNAGLSDAFSAPQLAASVRDQDFSAIRGEVVDDTLDTNIVKNVVGKLSLPNGKFKRIVNYPLFHAPAEAEQLVGYAEKLKQKLFVLELKDARFEAFKAFAKTKLAKFTGGLLSSIAKDFTKNAIFDWIDENERQAWRDYYTAELVARAYVPIYNATSNVYWDDWDHVQKLLRDKAQLEAAYVPDGNLHVVTNDAFSKSDTLRVVLDIAAGPDALAPEVWIAGHRATRDAAGVYSLPLSGVTPDVPGGYSLVLR